MLNFTNKTLDYQAKDGKWRKLKPISIMSAYALFTEYEKLIERLNSHDKDTEIWQLYITDSYFAELCNSCLLLGGVEPEDCSAEMLISFLFPHYGAGDQLVEQGIIFSFNFPLNKKRNSNKIVELAELVASLWTITENLEQSANLLEKLNMHDLDTILKYRKELLKPEKERKQKEGYDDALQIMKEKGLIVKW